MMSKSNFNDTWGVAWEVQKTIPCARSYQVEAITGAFFSSGRPKIDVVFYNDAGREICRRTGMTLLSKAGNEYQVCRREPERTPPPVPAFFTASDVLE